MAIHGGVDGYSRTIVYLKCAQNNRADTVMVAFNELLMNMAYLNVFALILEEKM